MSSLDFVSLSPTRSYEIDAQPLWHSRPWVIMSAIGRNMCSHKSSAQTAAQAAGQTSQDPFDRLCVLSCQGGTGANTYIYTPCWLSLCLLVSLLSSPVGFHEFMPVLCFNHFYFVIFHCLIFFFSPSCCYYFSYMMHGRLSKLIADLPGKLHSERIEEETLFLCRITQAFMYSASRCLSTILQYSFFFPACMFSLKKRKTEKNKPFGVRNAWKRSSIVFTWHKMSTIRWKISVCTCSVLRPSKFTPYFNFPHWVHKCK